MAFFKISHQLVYSGAMIASLDQYEHNKEVYFKNFPKDSAEKQIDEKKYLASFKYKAHSMISHQKKSNAAH